MCLDHLKASMKTFSTGYVVKRILKNGRKHEIVSIYQESKKNQCQHNSG